MRVVHGLDFEVEKGRVLALLGANGAGKTSTIMSLAGHVAVQEGRVVYQDQDITHASPMKRIKAGLAVVPEGRRLFPNLSVRENLIVGGYSRPKPQTSTNMQKVISLFPRLGERLNQTAGSLSGGEQQMLSLGRALMSEPQLIMIDELSLGLMPKMIDICYDALSELKKSDQTIILVEQSTERALEVADQVIVLESGRNVWQGDAEQARSDAGMIDACLGLSHNGTSG